VDCNQAEAASAWGGNGGHREASCIQAGAGPSCLGGVGSTRQRGVAAAVVAGAQRMGRAGRQKQETLETEKTARWMGRPVD
jgi:hypothetical protein